VAALFVNAVPYLLFAVAEQSVDSSTAGIIDATTPLWTIALALAVRHQKSLTTWQAAGLIVGFGGGLLRHPHFTAVSLAAVAILGVIGTGIAYVLDYQIITSEGATIASTVTYLLPVLNENVTG
jgi:drug/metabolite transporter (DMT)-like permease